MLDFQYVNCLDITSTDSLGIHYLNYENDTLTATVGLCINCGYQNIEAYLEMDSVTGVYNIKLLEVSDVTVELDANGDTVEIWYSMGITSCSCFKKMYFKFAGMSVEEFNELKIDGWSVMIRTKDNSCIPVVEEEVED
ncbi:hypothetical protein [Flammeovirga aprica]|uniref:Uncharacterized protein n=1 Tax=Flammeovirga aprica JL-4 TaxID=694437 RepID=A0A7X9S0D2_9BACT|nr:hypothetical protein [Flammeovirga aprica]NME72021.1 hypothetical protein [Flammeovirga aprica JL-4]